MEIDFGKSYKRRTATVKKTNNFSNLSRRITLLLSGLVVTFTVGLVSGLSLHKLEAQDNRETEFANVPPAALRDNVQINRVQKPEAEISQPKEKNKAQVLEQDKPITPKETSANIVKNKTKDLKQEKDQTSHLILAKVYDDPNEAHRYGLQLQKEGLPVFLAASGNRMKLYVGPIEGEKKARQQLAQIKRLPDFQGAILYRK